MNNYKFSFEVWKLFRQAGWYENRNVKNTLEITTQEYPNYPKFVLDFLYEFGGTNVNKNKNNTASESINFSPNIAKREMEENGTYHYYSDLIQTQLYPLGYTEQSGDLAVDNNGNIYTLGDYTVYD